MDQTRLATEASRLMPLAQQALGRYSLRVKQVQHLATHSNVLYRVVSEIGEQTVLRLGSPEANTRSNIELEVAWLDAIHRDTDLAVVRPLHAADGSLIVDATDPQSGQKRPCVLFSWIPGSPLGDGAGSYGYRLLGEMSAALQEHGRKWAPPSTDHMRRWDRIFYYDGMAPMVIRDHKYDHLFGQNNIRLIIQAAELAGAVISESWRRGEPQVVHGDLHEWNVHFASGRLFAFDFEDLMLALPAQDVAISLYSSRGGEHHQQAIAAFRRGFESISQWPVEDEAQLEGFCAARQIMLMNHAALTLPGKEAVAYIERVMPWLDGYVKRYR